VLVLLPPSEGKTRPRRGGAPVDLGALSFAELSDVRKAVLTEVIATSMRPDAHVLLGAGESLRSEVALNTGLWTASTAPAHRIYSGVLFDALGWSTLDASARRRGARQVLISSALWGWVRPGDRIPAYRLSMDSDLPGLGAPLARTWRAGAVEALVAAAGPRRSGVVVDCRSGPYANAAPIPPSLADRSVSVRVLREEAGTRSVVSHLAKHTRGEVTRHLLVQGAQPRTPQELVEALTGLRGTELVSGAVLESSVELAPPIRAGRPWELSVVLTG